MTTLFICKGNVGRSQMAQALYEQLTGETDVISAGTHVHDHEGERLSDFSPAAETLMVLNEFGIDASAKQRNQITQELADRADRIVSIVPESSLPEYVTNSGKVIYWDVIDPYQMTVDETRVVRDTIKELVEKL